MSLRPGHSPPEASSGQPQGLVAVKWPYCHQIVWNGGFLQKSGVPRLMGKAGWREERDQGCCHGTESWRAPFAQAWRLFIIPRGDGGGEERWGFNLLSQIPAAHGAYYPWLPVFCFLSPWRRAKTWLCSDLLTLLPECLVPVYLLGFCSGMGSLRDLSMQRQMIN